MDDFSAVWCFFGVVWLTGVARFIFGMVMDLRTHAPPVSEHVVPLNVEPHHRVQLP